MTEGERKFWNDTRTTKNYISVLNELFSANDWLIGGCSQKNSDPGVFTKQCIIAMINNNCGFVLT